MLCPVCRNEINNQGHCSECGFNDLAPIFLNRDELYTWINNVVAPYRQEYWLRCFSEYEFSGTTIAKYKGTNCAPVIPYGATKIGADAFHLSDIEKINLPETINVIGKYAFFRCFKLKEILIHENVNYIERGAFMWCNALERINVSGAGGRYYSDGVCLYDSLQATVITSINTESIVVKDGTLSIEEDAFAGKDKLKSISLPKSLRFIGDYAFNRCSNLEVVYIPKNVCTIGENIFLCCHSLTKIILPLKLTSMEHMIRECCNLNVQLQYYS